MTVTGLPNYSTYYMSHTYPNYEAWPAIVQLGDGTLICCYRTDIIGCHTFASTGRSVVRRSTDGVSWLNEITTAFDGVYDWCPCGMLVFDDGGTETVLLISWVREADEDVLLRMYCQKSTDGGLTWAAPVYITDVGDKRGGAPPPIELSNGDIIISVFQYPAGSIFIERSTDGGLTWNESLITTDAVNIPNETALLELKTGGAYTGKVMALARQEGEGPPYHLKKYTSTDYGVTWDAGVNIDLGTASLFNRTKPDLYRLPDGKILLTIGVIEGTYGLGLFISSDEAATWGYKKIIAEPVAVSFYPASICTDGFDGTSDSMIVTVWCSNGYEAPIGISDIYVTYSQYVGGVISAVYPPVATQTTQNSLTPEYRGVSYCDHNLPPAPPAFFTNTGNELLLLKHGNLSDGYSVHDITVTSTNTLIHNNYTLTLLPERGTFIGPYPTDIYGAFPTIEYDNTNLYISILKVVPA